MELVLEIDKKGDPYWSAENDIVTIDQNDLDNDMEISMSEATGTASPKTNSDDQFLKTFGEQTSSQLFSEVSEIGIVETPVLKTELDKDDVNSIETLSASECDDEEMAVKNKERVDISSFIINSNRTYKVNL